MEQRIEWLKISHGRYHNIASGREVLFSASNDTTGSVTVVGPHSEFDRRVTVSRERMDELWEQIEAACLNTGK